MMANITDFLNCLGVYLQSISLCIETVSLNDIKLVTSKLQEPYISLQSIIKPILKVFFFTKSSGEKAEVYQNSPNEIIMNHKDAS